MLKSFIYGAAFAVVLAGGHANAADYPDKPVHVIVPYGPGGGVDTFTRPIAIALGEQTGQSFVVENKSGGGGTIGVRQVARASSDGYTLLSGGVHQAMAEGIYPKRGYTLDQDFKPLSFTAVVPNVLIVNLNTPFKTVKELIDYAKQHPSELNYCSSGVGTAQHLVAEVFMEATSIKLTHIPYTGTAAALTDLMGGQCQVMFDGLGTSAQLIRTGKVRPLAFTTKTRSPYFPDIPTTHEAGGPDMDAGIWYAIWAPAKTPAERISYLQSQIATAMKSDMVKKAFEAQGATISDKPATELPSFVSAEVKRWAQIGQRTGAAKE
ncbi:ABC transporter substrate-binding protein [Advenella kashmirensis W13003]|uniref:ABC transporter substrate-binding protein n=1 Tax=Advenella kashmirensis W13003 TaxID=1424334 RepID=V8QRK4_9BURK|nr:tripartite tricarboxylate transporter substrate binding protein [Advenella kashmirensis]ETF02591.1 ABC transporter substrate-binding protein [Advenella kashmirensis W13003]